ncbi:ABC transporter permease [Cohnella sp. CIP 111063]|uniref:carbohydrate ABC transporter permease n=1 Tax=unclassified Cohnella TaxID=2636738 RepID=UPI000B8C6237|nr:MULTISPECIES: carbohydrate ABC transporter permease [unclassified Cohnella]OXS54758.1 ABC transporter permease [Cohnella sp. CIP 111063]PRX64596.1 putative aldouronate transport system permease protein [Cohnella sp. SGD-V74]
MIRASASDRLLSIFVYFCLTILGFVAFYPFWNAAVISFNEGTDTSMGGITFWPRAFTLANYQIVLENNQLVSAFVVSILRTTIGTALAILATAIFAFGMSRKELAARKFYMIFCVVTMYFSGGLIPYYLLIRDLGLMDTFWVMVIPGLVSVWNMIIFRTFFQGLPAGLAESAKIDGCGNWGVLFRIVLPLSGPVIATLALFTAINHWNDWFAPGLFISNADLLPIQTKLQQILNSNLMSQQMSFLDSAAASHMQSMKTVTSRSLTMATMMVATVPIILVYPFVQKYFVKGVLIGSMKE